MRVRTRDLDHEVSRLTGPLSHPLAEMLCHERGLWLLTFDRLR